jgi:hypothetical protein
MRASIKLILLGLAVAGIAYAARLIFAPDIVPLPQSEIAAWKFQAAFLLQAVVNMALFGAALAALALISAVVKQWRGSGSRLPH